MSLSRKQGTDTVSLPEKLRVEKGKWLSREELHVIIEAHHAALRTGEGVLKDRHRNAVTSVRHGNDWFCVKEYRSLGLPDRIKDRLRRSRARRAWKGTSHLRKHGIAAPEAVSQVEQDGKSYLVTRFINGAVALNLLLYERFSGRLDRVEVAAKRTMVKQLGQWLRSIHDLDIYHDDWSSKNILATQHNEQWTFHTCSTWKAFYPENASPIDAALRTSAKSVMPPSASRAPTACVFCSPMLWTIQP